MDKREVAGWISCRRAESARYQVDIGDWGGGASHTDSRSWQEHLSRTEPRLRPYHDALRRAVLARGLRRGGDWHQSATDGVPVFDDGAIGTFTFRAWGALLAAIWGPEDGRVYSYMDFYMDDRVKAAGMALSPP